MGGIRAKMDVAGADVASKVDVRFGRTIIDWEEQRLIFQFSSGASYTKQMTEAEYDYFMNGIKGKTIPGVTGKAYESFDPDAVSEAEEQAAALRAAESSPPDIPIVP